MGPSLKMGGPNRTEEMQQFPRLNSKTLARSATLAAVQENPTWKEKFFNRQDREPTSVVESLKSFLPSISSMPKWRRAKSLDVPATPRWKRSEQASDLKPTPPPPGNGTTPVHGSTDPRKLRLRPDAQENVHSQDDDEHSPSERKERSISLPDAFHTPRRVPEPKLHALIPGKLYFALHANEAQTRELIETRPDLFVFSSILHEASNCRTFGAVDIGTVHCFWKHVQSKATHPRLSGRPLVYYSDFSEVNKANAAFLLAAYMILEHGMGAEEAGAKVEELGPMHMAHCVASKVPRASMPLVDYLRGLEKAVAAGHFNKDTFDATDFEWLVLSGDMSALCGKFVAFRGPTDHQLTASFYAGKLKARGVSDVVRLNEANTYYAEHFETKGIRHHQLFFRDGSCPGPDVIETFLRTCDSAEGMVGVHCLAGLGRTGTLIALWLMRRAGFTAREAVAWVRLVRPGSVIGQQQAFVLRCGSVEWDGDRPRLPAADLDNVKPVTVLQTGRSALPRAPSESKARRIQGEGGRDIARFVRSS